LKDSAILVVIMVYLVNYNNNLVFVQKC